MSGWAVELFLPYHSERLYGDNFCARDGRLFYDWLNEHLGHTDFSKSAGSWRWTVHKNRQIPDGTGTVYGDMVCFRDTKDAMFFKLTWL